MRRPPRRVALLVATVAAAALLLASCGDSDEPSDLSTGEPTGSFTPTSSVPMTDSTGAFDERTANTKLVTSRDDLVDEREASPIAVDVDPEDDRTVGVRFWGGVHPCYGARVAVDETPATVTVRLYTGTPPEGIGRVCIQIAELQEIRVQLTSPLGDRDLVANT